MALTYRGIYKFKPISADRDEIRIVKLLPGVRGDPIKVTLSTESFHPEHEDAYTSSSQDFDESSSTTDEVSSGSRMSAEDQSNRTAEDDRETEHDLSSDLHNFQTAPGSCEIGRASGEIGHTTGDHREHEDEDAESMLGSDKSEAVYPTSSDRYAGVPKYEAISYAWGSPLDRTAIAIVDAEDYRSLGVTCNCAEALRYLRYPDRSRSLWVDAICIDQGLSEASLTERARQVAIMVKIFRFAERVVAWLGPSLLGDEIVKNWVEAVHSNMKYDDITPGAVPRTSGSIWSDLRRANITREESTALSGYITRAW
ncbi:Hypothetical predicted protein [Lecanosticta acicola]|uniref:Heterokaryon incompatibility domain-containing protein n=1 Tax=Lecanosticta acicola TaxID=111012 RepID=A0AAI8YU06_9PEZI|nr:Hypothetical predicted protein [Lecanosticta acicola]